MPYDPNWPQNGQLIDGDRFREQFAGIKTLIDAVQSGGITGVQVDAISTLPPGTQAIVGLSLSGSVLHFTFGLPQGNDGAAGANGSDGAQGQPGNNGSDGAPGMNGSDGQQGPPFAQAVVDAVNTLDPGQPAAVSVNFDGSNVRFTFGIPQGNDGAQGPPGEVSQTDLNNAAQNMLSQSSANTNGVSTLDSPFTNDPPTLADMEVVRAAYNALVNALRR